MGGFMPTPPAPAQPPQVKLDTTATSRGNFSTFLKNMNGANLSNPPSMAPSVGAATPTLAPTMSDIDVFNPPVQMMFTGGEASGEFSDTDDSPAGTFGGAEGGGEFSDTNALDSMANTGDFGDFSGGGFDEKDDEDSARGGDFLTGDDGIFTGYGAGYGKTIEDQIDQNPQLQGFLGNRIRNLVDKGKVSQFEYDKQGQLTGVYGRSQVPGAVGGIMSLLGIPTTVTTYTGYGKGFDDMLGGGDDNDDPLLRKLPSEKKEEEDMIKKPPNIIGGTDPIVTLPVERPTVVASPFAPATSNIEPIGFDSGELNKLIELLTGVPAKPVVAAKEGGLIKAVDDFLATGT